MIASASQDNSFHHPVVNIFDAETGRNIRNLAAGMHRASSVSFSADGTLLAAAVADANYQFSAHVWDIATSRLIAKVGPSLKKIDSEQIDFVKFVQDSKSIVIHDPGVGMKIWDIRRRELIKTIKGRFASAVAISPTGNVLVAGGAQLTAWDIGAEREALTFPGAPDCVASVALSTDSRTLALLTCRGHLSLWSAENGRQLQVLRKSGQLGRGTISFSKDGSRLIEESHTEVWAEDYGPTPDVGKIRLWDISTGKSLQTYGGVGAPAISADGGLIAAGAPRTPALLVWKAASTRPMQVMKGHSDYIRAAAFSPDARTIVTASEDDTAIVWDVSSGRSIRRFTLGAFSNRDAGPRTGAVAISSDGSLVAAGNKDGVVTLLKAATGRPLWVYHGNNDEVAAIAFSPKNRKIILVFAGKAAHLVILDVLSGAFQKQFAGDLGETYTAAVLDDGRRAYTGGGDATIRFWNGVSGALAATNVRFDDGDWITITPSGFFVSSVDGARKLKVVRGLEAGSAGQVHQSLFNPDLVRESLAGDPGGEVAAATKVINLDKVMASGPPPSVLLKSPARSSSDVVTVDVLLEDRGKGIGRIEWRVNGITAAVLAAPLGQGPVYTVSRELALDPGDNTIEAVAYNARNLLASPPARATVKFTGPADKTRPKLHILAIGINAYVDSGWMPPGAKRPEGFGPLGLAVKDATAFAAGMKQAASGMYGDVRVTLALDRDATRANLNALIEKLAAEIHPRDSFVLFAAAHGKSEDGRYHLIPQDYQSGPGHLAKYAIGQEDLQDWLANRIKARKGLILLDTCESGALIAGHMRSRTDAPITEAGIGRLHEATGRPVLAAAALGQEAKEGIIGKTGQSHGYFTYTLLDALSHGDTSGNGLIELSELVAHVQAAVPKIASGKSIRGLATFSATDIQAARFGSRGEDYVLAKRLQ
jgi:WD40 repeat protein